MPIPDFVLLVVSAVGGVCAGLAYAMTARERPHFRAAKMLLWISGISFWSLGVIWAATSPSYPIWLRVGVAVIVGAVSAGGLAWFLSDFQLAYAGTPPPAVTSIPATGNKPTAQAPKPSEPNCPPGTGICLDGGSSNQVIDNTCVGQPHCIVSHDEHGDTFKGNRSLPH